MFTLQVGSVFFVMATGRFVSLKLIYARHTKTFSISVFKLKIRGGVFLVWLHVQVPKGFKSKSGHWQWQYLSYQQLLFPGFHEGEKADPITLVCQSL